MNLAKLAKEQTPDTDWGQHLIDAGLVAGGGLALDAARDPLLGKVRAYHGTSKTNADGVYQEGIKTSRGGIGGESDWIGIKRYQDASKDHVFITRHKGSGRYYANSAEAPSKAQSIFAPPDAKQVFKDFLYVHNPKGKLIHLDLDYDKYQRMNYDPESFEGLPRAKRGQFLHEFYKYIAGKGAEDIDPEEIIGSKASMWDRYKRTFSKWPQYVKENPKRFARGVGLAGLGAGSMGYGAKDWITGGDE